MSRCDEHDKHIQQWRGERLGSAYPGPSLARYRGQISGKNERKAEMSVFVLDQHQQPLMPCSQRRARLLLVRKRAVVHRLVPFTIRLKDRQREECQVQPIALKFDPGSKTTGIALARVEHTQQ